jgi:vancomycin resistance protein YoaR
MSSPLFQPQVFKKNLVIFWLSFLTGISFLVGGLILLQTSIDLKQNIFLNQTKIENIEVSSLTKTEAISKIKNALGQKRDFQIAIKVAADYQNNEESQIPINSNRIMFEMNIEESVEEAFAQNHLGFSLKSPLRLFSLITKEKSYQIKNTFEKQAAQNTILSFSNLIDDKGNDPYASLKKTNQPKTLLINPGKEGLEIDQAALLQKISAKLMNKKDFSDLEILTSRQTTHFELSPEEIEQAEERALIFVGQNIWLKNKANKDVKIKLIDTQIIPTLAFPQGFHKEKVAQMVNQIDENTARDSENAEFDYEKESDDKLEISSFKPHKTGLKLEQVEFKKILIQALQKTEQVDQKEKEKEKEDIVLELPLKITQPEITLEKTNDLGINELIGFGDSEYDHSIPNRIFNVAHATKRVTNTIIAPGEEFRFNNTLGEVSRRTGYKSAYVISEGKTILGDGGGVCQVSTTVFRAALNAGLPITKRKQHSYRVSYYELNQKPGIDATVYSGDVDLRFINDTSGHILIRGEADSDELYMKMEIYGTSDGRTTEIVDHKTWGERGAPTSVYYPSPDLAPGVIKQIDWSVSGIKASFKNVTKDKDGEIIREEEFYSNYVPWSAKFLRGI